MPLIAYFDIEANPDTKQILDIGAVLADGSTFHKNLAREFKDFVNQADFLCGYNILAHDLAYLQKQFGDRAWEPVPRTCPALCGMREKTGRSIPCCSLPCSSLSS